jgi:hypothetical protein
VLRKFHDLDRDGRHDAIEPMLPDIPFVITVDSSEIRLDTDARGTARVCWPNPVDAHLEELTRPTGGQWVVTTAGLSTRHVSCGDNELWIGNAQIGAPRTGTRGGHAKWRAAGGPQDIL